MSKQRKILEPKYIVSFIIKFSAIVFVGFGIFGAFVIILLSSKIGPTYQEGFSALKQIKDSLPFIIFIAAAIQALSLCTIATLFALFWSHSIAGPLVRFRKYLKDISQGNFLKEPVVFRSGDQLQGLAQAFSEMIIAHKNDATKALTLLVEAQRILDKCKMLQAQGKENSEEFHSNLKKLKTIYLRLKDIYALKISS